MKLKQDSLIATALLVISLFCSGCDGRITSALPTAPTPPNITSPATNSIITSSPVTLNYVQYPNASAYTIQYSTDSTFLTNHYEVSAVDMNDGNWQFGNGNIPQGIWCFRVIAHLAGQQNASGWGTPVKLNLQY
jgi:hypothetical protein